MDARLVARLLAVEHVLGALIQTHAHRSHAIRIDLTVIKMPPMVVSLGAHGFLLVNVSHVPLQTRVYLYERAIKIDLTEMVWQLMVVRLDVPSLPKVYALNVQLMEAVLQ